MTIKLEILIKESQVFGPFTFLEVPAPDPEIAQAEQGIAQALGGPIAQLLHPKKGRILKPDFFKKAGKEREK